MYERTLSRRFPADLPAWTLLEEHYRSTGSSLDIGTSFRRDSRRAERFSMTAGDLYVDYSKHRIAPTTMRLLTRLAREAGVIDLRDAMFAGDHINTTEDRAVLHVALRARKSDRYRDGQQNCTKDVLAVREQMSQFVKGVHNGRLCGHGGRKFTDIVNIGIGGSDLGIAMAVRALGHLRGKRPVVHCVSNVDGTQLADLQRTLNPATTLFVICSKTFTTQETMSNARAARRWLVSKLGKNAVHKHFAAASTNHQAMDKFGINPDYRFGFWDWVGGRYSLWSAIGLSIALSVGWNQFEAMLDGGRKIDLHFRKAKLEKNAPVVMALLSIWYRSFFGTGSHAILPYDNRLDRFPAFLQQLQMESNGKSVRVDGLPVNVPTGGVIWGEAGNNAQHSFYQLLHQGTDLIPADFIAPVRSSGGGQGQQRLALANCLAQSRALMVGRPARELAKAARSPRDRDLISHRVHPGNRPSTTILLPQLDASTLGQLIAIYEHKTFVEGVLMGVNSFDQWGVELGKVLATEMAAGLQSPKSMDSDRSTKALLGQIARWS